VDVDGAPGGSGEQLRTTIDRDGSMKKKPAKRTHEAMPAKAKPRARAKPAASKSRPITPAKPSPRARSGNDLPARGPRAAKAGTSAKPSKRGATRTHPPTPHPIRARGRGTSPAKPAKRKAAAPKPPAARTRKAPPPPQRRAPAPPTRVALAAKTPPRPRQATPKLSQTPAAKRARAARRAAEADRDRRNEAARKRYAERRGIAQQQAAQAQARREAAKAARKIGGKVPRGKKPRIVDERTLAIGWLEAIREHFAAHVPTSFDVTEAEIGSKTPWLVVGRYDFLDVMDYATLAAALEDIANDVVLEASIHPSRLSQIRIVFADPNAKRGESDSFLSKIGSWEMILSDLIGELVGGGEDDEGALANRYAETAVTSVYVYFSSELVSYTTAPGFADKRNQTVKMRP
jgi:hypothetical protein